MLTSSTLLNAAPLRCGGRAGAKAQRLQRPQVRRLPVVTTVVGSSSSGSSRNDDDGRNLKIGALSCAARKLAASAATAVVVSTTAAVGPALAVGGVVLSRASLHPFIRST